MYKCFVSLSLVVSTSAIDCLERLLQNDLLYVEWDVKPTHSPCNGPGDNFGPLTLLLTFCNPFAAIPLI